MRAASLQGATRDFESLDSRRGRKNLRKQDALLDGRRCPPVSGRNHEVVLTHGSVADAPILHDKKPDKDLPFFASLCESLAVMHDRRRTTPEGYENGGNFPTLNLGTRGTRELTKCARIHG